MGWQWPWKSRRFCLVDLAVLLVLAAVAARAVIAVLPSPLHAERRRVVLAVFISAAPAGLEEALRPGERVWCARNGAVLGRVSSVSSRPATMSRRPGWSMPRDILILLAGTGRFQAERGLYLGRNLAIRVGETYPLRCTLGSFWGRVERISLTGKEVSWCLPPLVVSLCP